MGVGSGVGVGVKVGVGGTAVGVELADGVSVLARKGKLLACEQASPTVIGSKEIMNASLLISATITKAYARVNARNCETLTWSSRSNIIKSEMRILIPVFVVRQSNQFFG